MSSNSFTVKRDASGSDLDTNRDVAVPVEIPSFRGLRRTQEELEAKRERGGVATATAATGWNRGLRRSPEEWQAKQEQVAALGESESGASNLQSSSTRSTNPPVLRGLRKKSHQHRLSRTDRDIEIAGEEENHVAPAIGNTDAQELELQGDHVVAPNDREEERSFVVEEAATADNTETSTDMQELELQEDHVVAPNDREEERRFVVEEEAVTAARKPASRRCACPSLGCARARV